MGMKTLLKVVSLCFAIEICVDLSEREHYLFGARVRAEESNAIFPIRNCAFQQLQYARNQPP